MGRLRGYCTGDAAVGAAECVRPLVFRSTVTHKSCGSAFPDYVKIPATGAGGINDFVTNFTKRYIAGGHLVAGRAVVVVNTAWGAW